MSWNPFKRRSIADGTVPPVSSQEAVKTDEDTTMPDDKKDDKAKAADPAPTPPPPADEKEKKKDDEADPAAADKAASVSELKLAFADEPAFIVEAIDKKWSLQQAKAERHDRLAAENAKLKKSITKLGDEGTGHGGVGAADSKATSREHQGGGRSARALPSDPYLAAVEKTMQEKNVSRGEATKIVNREQPQLRIAYSTGARA